jgi:hypothetical protein
MKNFEGIDLNLLDDGDPRAMAALERLRAEWDNAPANAALNGAAIRIAGYVVPLDGMGETLNEFLLVAYFGACIHTPPPPSNQIIHVTLEHPAPGIQSMDTVWVEGVLQTGHSVTDMGDSSYRMQAARVDVFK